MRIEEKKSCKFHIILLSLHYFIFLDKFVGSEDENEEDDGDDAPVTGIT